MRAAHFQKEYLETEGISYGTYHLEEDEDKKVPGDVSGSFFEGLEKFSQGELAEFVRTWKNNNKIIGR